MFSNLITLSLRGYSECVSTVQIQPLPMKRSEMSELVNLSLENVLTMLNPERFLLDEQLLCLIVVCSECCSSFVSYHSIKHLNDAKSINE